MASSKDKACSKECSLYKILTLKTSSHVSYYIMSQHLHQAYQKIQKEHEKTKNRQSQHSHRPYSSADPEVLLSTEVLELVDLSDDPVGQLFQLLGTMLFFK